MDTHKRSSLRRPATTTNFLPDDVLLDVFDLFRIEEATTSRRIPWKWQRLAHVCRTWRDIILASSSRLNLELLCTHGTPVRKILRHLPPLPIVIHFPSSLKGSASIEDNVNILGALEHPDRIRNIKLSLSRLSLGYMVAMMRRPFLTLTHLWLNSNDGETLVIPDSFLGGRAPRLQEIYLDDISFPAAPTLLSSACNLVDIRFENIPDTGYISPEAMAASLAPLSRLKHLTIRFSFEDSWPGQRSHPPITRAVLPALTTFFFDGVVEYLEDFVAHIDAPQLNCLSIEYLNSTLHFDSPILQLCGLIDRSENFKLSQFRRADLELRTLTFVIELDGGRSSLKLSIPFAGGLTGLLSQIFGTLSNVDSLFVSSVYLDEVDDEIEWSDILPLFTAVKELRARDYVSQRIAFELGRLVEEQETAEVLPALELLYLEDQGSFVDEFVAARRNAGRPVTLVNEEGDVSEGSDIGN
ncbi:hypothetical protein EDB89DRAFT_180115 [Lactarius sanguifluus]|nr:hypothetical protein EDB89DRAFT_180115 [Lactarius sanguifluus]